MFECRACISRCIRALFSDASLNTSQLASLDLSIATGNRRHATSTLRRNYHATATLSQPSHHTVPKIGTSRRQTTQAIPRTDDYPKLSSSPTNTRENEQSAPTDRVALANPERIAKQLEERKHAMKRELQRELTFLEDPLKLAENTIKLLRKDDTEKALEIVRLASKRTSCVVSWNHIIDYQMSKGWIQPAEKVYNEVPTLSISICTISADKFLQMKKRGQKPDAQTYTILLRGFSWHPHLQQTLPRALHIYHSMFAENCPIKPNIIHTNAMLNVCAKAKDLDALLGVAARLPSKGPGAPNNLTYTTIINAIRNIAWNDSNDSTDPSLNEKSLIRQRAVLQGRRLWEEIIARWRAGDVSIDEELVCAMGRLLLLGSTERDNEDVLSLAEQVMAIPRQKKRSRELNQSTDVEDAPTATPKLPGPTDPTRQASSNPGNIAFEDDIDPPSPVSNTSSTELTTELKSVFIPGETPSRLTTAIPGRNTLSLLLNACINLRAVSPAQTYWGLLTSPEGSYNISPDSDNYHMYLRLLRVQRASRAAAELVKDLHEEPETKNENGKELLQPKTFRIAMSSCARDRRNPNAMQNAMSILATMMKALQTPDTKVVSMYVNLISDVSKRDYKSALAALELVEKPMKLLKNWVNFGHGEFEDQLAVLGLARGVLGAMQTVMDRGGDRVEQDEKRPLSKMRGWLTDWVQRRKRLNEARGKGKTILDDLAPAAGDVSDDGLIRTIKTRGARLGDSSRPSSDVRAGWQRDLREAELMPEKRQHSDPTTTIRTHGADERRLNLTEDEPGSDVRPSLRGRTLIKRLDVAKMESGGKGDALTQEEVLSRRWPLSKTDKARLERRRRGRRRERDGKRRGPRTEGGGKKRMQRAERVRKRNEELDYE
ncbi:MAG: hypothetical protein L6R37_001632 [Teloschistes peruensis]|nr:MAG: hypothetical protein L6R37_001632 [Teloschistes peruensis]